MSANIKIGDKVRYLNSVGGGIVSGFKSKSIVLVEEEDGFETPCLISELVVVEDTNEYNFPIDNTIKDIKKRNRESFNSNANDFDENAEEEIKQPEYTWNERNETKEGEKLSVYLAFVPKDIKQLQSTELDLYIINDSNYYLQFAIYSGKEEFRLRDINLVEPQTKLYLETINNIGLNDLENLRFNGFTYKKIPFISKPVLDIKLRINPVKFYKLHSFVENDYFNEDAMLVTIIKDDVMDLGMMIDPAKLQEAIVEKSVDNSKHHAKRINIKPSTIEVDLHINQLLDNTKGMSNIDMLNYQIETFERIMNENLKNKGQKIVFIHGKGEGVLRAELEKILKKKYYKCQFQDASFQKYGFGATQVTIH